MTSSNTKKIADGYGDVIKLLPQIVSDEITKTPMRNKVIKYESRYLGDLKEILESQGVQEEKLDVEAKKAYLYGVITGRIIPPPIIRILNRTKRAARGQKTQLEESIIERYSLAYDFFDNQKEEKPNEDFDGFKEEMEKYIDQQLEQQDPEKRTIKELMNKIRGLEKEKEILQQKLMLLEDEYRLAKEENARYASIMYKLKMALKGKGIR